MSTINLFKFIGISTLLALWSSQNLRAAQVFAAVVEDGTAKIVSHDDETEEAENPPKEQKVQQITEQKHESQETRKPESTSTVTKRGEIILYDVVPEKRVSELAERLKYTNEILKRFGRAYDYRTTTLTEFKKILSELEKKN